MPKLAGKSYIGHNYVGHDYIGHSYVGHNYRGHDNVGHNYLPQLAAMERLAQALSTGWYLCVAITM